MKDVGVSVIIPTAAWPERAASLRRAIASVLAQEGVDLELIVVANGERRDPDLMRELRAHPRLRLVEQEEPDLPTAQRHGRLLVTRPFFSFLDDDDVYLPGCLRTRAAPLLEDATVDVVATNGVWGGSGEPYIRKTSGVEADPLGALLRGNWLGSCGALFRTATVDETFFAGNRKYFEWTMVAFRIALAGLRVRFLDVPTYQMNLTDGSLSRSEAYYRTEPEFLTELLRYPLQPAHTRRIREKRLAALHFLADRYAAQGRFDLAWRYHLRSMRWPGGARYAVFTRRLILPTLRTLARRLAGEPTTGHSEKGRRLTPANTLRSTDLSRTRHR